MSCQGEGDRLALFQQEDKIQVSPWEYNLPPYFSIPILGSLDEGIGSSPGWNRSSWLYTRAVSKLLFKKNDSYITLVSSRHAELGAPQTLDAF